ncbi:DinB family protein [Flavobacterium sp. WC2509]|uniref:DinB family protein n=1 Tax=Flavobacterium sp. WC2509 TaxID=3461406 RepID=UPI004044BEF1
MNKNEIIINLNTAHLTFWETAIHLPNANISKNDKWSVTQNVEHITLTLSRVTNYLSLPKSNIESNFGLSKRESNTYEEFIKNFQNVIANGITTTTPFIPESNLETDSKESVNQGKKILEAFISSLQNWSEDELEKYNCPHPVLGKITAREILYFTIYHVQHHNEIIIKNYAK